MIADWYLVYLCAVGSKTTRLVAAAVRKRVGHVMRMNTCLAAMIARQKLHRGQEMRMELKR